MTFNIKNAMIHFHAKCPICNKNDHVIARTWEFVNPMELKPTPKVLMEIGCIDCSEIMLCSIDPDMNEETFRRYVDFELLHWFEEVGKDPRIHAYNTYRTYCVANGTDPKPYWKFNLDEMMETNYRKRMICNLSIDYEVEEEEE